MSNKKQTLQQWVEEFEQKASPGEKATHMFLWKYLDNVEAHYLLFEVERQKSKKPLMDEKEWDHMLRVVSGHNVYLTMPKMVRQWFDDNAAALQEALKPREDSPGREDGAP